MNISPIALCVKTALWRGIYEVDKQLSVPSVKILTQAGSQIAPALPTEKEPLFYFRFMR